MDCQKASEASEATAGAAGAVGAAGAAEAAERAAEAAAAPVAEVLAATAAATGALSSRSADATWCLCPSLFTPSVLSSACSACDGKHQGPAKVRPEWRGAGATSASGRRPGRQLGAANRGHSALATSGVLSRHSAVCPRVVGGVKPQQRVELRCEAVAHRLWQAERRQLRCEEAPSSPPCHAALVHAIASPPAPPTNMHDAACWQPRPRCVELGFLGAGGYTEPV